jgi:hypothetical protein
MARRLVAAALTLALGGLAGSALAQPGEADFKARLAALKSKTVAHFQIQMAPKDDPSRLPETATSGLTVVSGGRMGLWEPPILSADDMAAVVQQHMVDVRKCYKKQLGEDPEWADELILDIAVKKTGRVSEVSISPGRVRRDPIGQCLMSAVPKWKFPKFTGEVDEGIVQEVVNASFPFTFSTH